MTKASQVGAVRRVRSWAQAVLVICVMPAILLTACGSSSSSTTTQSSGTTAATATAQSTTSSAGTTDAEAAIQPYLDQPSAFPVTQPLKRVPKGAKILFMNPGDDVDALTYQVLQVAAKTMGVQIQEINTGAAANTVGTAWDSALNLHPAAVIAPANPVQLFATQLKEFQKAGIPVVTAGQPDARQYGVTAAFITKSTNLRDGKLLADYVVAKFGSDSNIVFYDVPELPFSTQAGQAFQAELEQVCPSCKLRTISIPVASVGTTSASQVVSDLQSHPSTTVAVFGTDNIEVGLPSKLNAAGISKIKTVGFGPTPVNLQQIKSGGETVGLASDFGVYSWMLLDAAAREIIKQPLAGLEAQGVNVVQFLTQKDITFNPAEGWSGYPDYQSRFRKLWSGS